MNSIDAASFSESLISPKVSLISPKSVASALDHVDQIEPRLMRHQMISEKSSTLRSKPDCFFRVADFSEISRKRFEPH